MDFRQPYTPPEVTCVAFRQENGFTASPGVPEEHVNQFLLINPSGDQQGQQGIEQMTYHSDWGETDNHFFN